MATSTIRCPHCGRTNRVPAAAQGRPRCGNCHRALPWIVDAGDDDFADIAEKSSQFVVVDLWAPWCGPCHTVSPALERLAAEMAGQVKLVKVNVDDAQALARRFEVQAVPTLLLLHHGQVIARQSGAAPVHVLRGWVEDAIAKTTPAGASA